MNPRLKLIIGLFNNLNVKRMEYQIEKLGRVRDQYKQELKDLENIHAYTMMAIADLKSAYEDMAISLHGFNDEGSTQKKHCALRFIQNLNHVEDIKKTALNAFDGKSLHGSNLDDLFI